MTETRTAVRSGLTLVLSIPSSDNSARTYQFRLRQRSHREAAVSSKSEATPACRRFRRAWYRTSSRNA